MIPGGWDVSGREDILAGREREVQTKTPCSMTCQWRQDKRRISRHDDDGTNSGPRLPRQSGQVRKNREEVRLSSGSGEGLAYSSVALLWCSTLE